MIIVCWLKLQTIQLIQEFIVNHAIKWSLTLITRLKYLLIVRIKKCGLFCAFLTGLKSENKLKIVFHGLL